MPIEKYQKNVAVLLCTVGLHLITAGKGEIYPHDPLN